MSDATGLMPPWLLFLPQLPAKPAYARVKVWRRLAEIGAVAVKNAVHALPNSAQSREDFEWLLREVEAAGGEAAICEANLLNGLSDEDFLALRRNGALGLAHAQLLSLGQLPRLQARAAARIASMPMPAV